MVPPNECEGRMSEFLFVYGTLARNARHEMHRYLAPHADYAGEGYFQGRLYRVAHYPAAVPSSHRDDKVFGELYRIKNSRELFAELDDYEGSEFMRRREPVYLANGTRSEAWIYLFKGSVSNLPRIMSGRFVEQ
jgi:gamma-glutamylcyclotransferase (GGCT)/AIG2-like uncharacterized protein YtfP